ncbi:hypothetical protein D9M71_764110 [compost metagenome]
MRPFLRLVLRCGTVRVGGIDEVAIDVGIAQIERGSRAFDESAVFIGVSDSRRAGTECQGQADQRVRCGHVAAETGVAHGGCLAVNYYFFQGSLQLATEFQAQAALATICQGTAV